MNVEEKTVSAVPESSIEPLFSAAPVTVVFVEFLKYAVPLLLNVPPKITFCALSVRVVPSAVKVPLFVNAPVNVPFALAEIVSELVFSLSPSTVKVALSFISVVPLFVKSPEIVVPVVSVAVNVPPLAFSKSFSVTFAASANVRLLLFSVVPSTLKTDFSFIIAVPLFVNLSEIVVSVDSVATVKLAPDLFVKLFENVVFAESESSTVPLFVTLSLNVVFAVPLAFTVPPEPFVNVLFTNTKLVCSKLKALLFVIFPSN